MIEGATLVCPQRKAFFLNIYNSLTLHGMVHQSAIKGALTAPKEVGRSTYLVFCSRTSFALSYINISNYPMSDQIRVYIACETWELSTYNPPTYYTYGKIAGAWLLEHHLLQHWRSCVQPWWYWTWGAEGQQRSLESNHWVFPASAIPGHPAAKKAQFSNDDPRSNVALTTLDPRCHYFQPNHSFQKNSLLTLSALLVFLLCKSTKRLQYIKYEK